MANSRKSAMAAGRAASPIPEWRMRCRTGTPRPPRIPAIRVRTRCSPSDIRKSCSISASVPFTRWPLPQRQSSPLSDRNATAATDTGHKGANSVFAIGHPEKLLDLGERSVHEMAVAAKAVIAAFYDRAPARSYWNGCSTGGRQGLMAAQKYPNDFDGIVAGAPANNWAHMHAWDMSVSKPVFKDPAGKIPAASLAMLNRAVIQACDQSDGITDGIISNPKACTFDPAVLQCRESSTNACLTPSQVESARRMYTSVNDRTGRVVFPGKERGSESGRS